MKLVNIKVITTGYSTEEIGIYVNDNMDDESILRAIKEGSSEFCKGRSDTFSYQDFIKYARLNLEEYNRIFEEKGIVFADYVPTRSISVSSNELILR